MTQPQKHRLFLDIGAACGILILCIVTGQSFNAMAENPVPPKYESRDQRLAKDVARLQEAGGQAPVETQNFTIGEVSLEEIKAASKSGSPKILDARHPAFQELLGTIPGAISMPIDEFQPAYEASSIGSIPKNEPLILFCSDIACPDSEKLAKALQTLGHSNLLIFPGGWEEWENAQ